MDIKELTLKEKICQMFIVGFQGQSYFLNRNFVSLLEGGLGGVIFFSHNINSENQFKELILKLSKEAEFPMFYSIDQEGGRVERTEKIHNGKKYLSAKNALEMGVSYLQNQTKEMALELKSYGINMNFAPVLDVNTNPDNPIIGERAYSSDTDEVIYASKAVIKEYEKYGIITVGKHFPGHGASNVDSHKTMPIINLEKDDLYEHHIRPFKEAIDIDIPAIMVAHVAYPSLDNSNIPASVSEKIINNILIKELNFKGVIITDDMEMNGIKEFSRLQACIMAINAGINMFIFRDSTKEISELITNLTEAINDGRIKEELINNSVEKIINLKYRYGIVK
ncbi:beta-N-acetylhexosaminidase [bacterium]|nr:beta-N-acetylhexosaminidase [bacterium]